jgi:hypothetical protein
MQQLCFWFNWFIDILDLLYGDKSFLSPRSFYQFIDILIVVQYYLKAGIPVISIPALIDEYHVFYVITDSKFII